MIDKDRQRHRVTPAPHGQLPNWVLVAVAGGISLVAVIAQTLVR